MPRCNLDILLSKSFEVGELPRTYSTIFTPRPPVSRKDRIRVTDRVTQLLIIQTIDILIKEISRSIFDEYNLKHY